MGAGYDYVVCEGGGCAVGQAVGRWKASEAEADSERIVGQLSDIALHRQWRKALDTWLLDKGLTGAQRIKPQITTSFEQPGAELLYRRHRQEISAKVLSLIKELAANRAEQLAAAAERARSSATLAVLEQRVVAYKTLLDKQYGAKVQYLEMLQQKTELALSIPVLASREQQLSENAAAIAARISATLGEFRKQNLMELVRLDGERRALLQESQKAQQHQRQLLLNAPVAGTVQELAIHTVGAVVSPGQVLMKIVPASAAIEVEALLQNKDIGFVNAGQSAEVKIDTFNFTKYGLIGARIDNVSNDAIEDQQLGWVFKMRLKLDRDSITVANKTVQLSPGMSVTAEIKTGKRRLIEFFLSPLLRYKQESVRER